MRNLFFCSVFFIPLFCVNLFADDVEIIAHRGSSFTAPENTVASVKLGYEQNADAVEIDIYMTKDKQIMVIHDENTSRTAGVDMKITESMAQDVRKLDVGSFKSEKYKGEKIPYLPEIINLIPPDKKLFIEIKHGEKILPSLYEVLGYSKKISQIVIIGFKIDTIAKVKEKIPDMPVYWLVSAEKDKTTKKPIPYDESLIAKAKEKKMDGLNLNYNGLTEDFVKKVKEAKLKIYVWTVDDPVDAMRLKKMGVDGITTNKPDLIRKVLSEK